MSRHGLKMVPALLLTWQSRRAADNTEVERDRVSCQYPVLRICCPKHLPCPGEDPYRGDAGEIFASTALGLLVNLLLLLIHALPAPPAWQARDRVHLQPPFRVCFIGSCDGGVVLGLPVVVDRSGVIGIPLLPGDTVDVPGRNTSRFLQTGQDILTRQPGYLRDFA